MTNRNRTTRPTATARARRRASAEIIIILALILCVGLAGSLWYFVLQPSLADSAPASAGTVVSKPAPDFTAQDLAGNTVRLSDYRGRPVVLNAWATWCGPCQMEMPDLERLHQEYNPQGVIVLAVNMGEPKQQVATFIKTKGYTFPVLLDETTAAVGRPYRISGIPATFFINRAGQIADVQVGAMSLAEMKRRLAAIL